MLLAEMGTACWSTLSASGTAQVAIRGTRVPPSHFEPFLPRIGQSLKLPVGSWSCWVAGLSVTVVTEEQDQGFLRHAEIDQFLADIADGNVHPFDHGRKLCVIAIDGS